MQNIAPVLLIFFIIVIFILITYQEQKKIYNKSKKCIFNNGKPLVKIKQIVYTDILKKTKKALSRLNIPMFLSSGTCLGYLREGKFIDYDYDIDVGIFAKHYTPKIIDEMKKENLYLYRVLGNVKSGMELSFMMPKTPLGKYAKIDIFLHYFEKDKKGNHYISWFSYAYPKFKKKIKYRVSAFKIKEVKFMGVNVYVPYPTIKYIENHYGEDWMVPKRPFIEYVYHKSPKSIVKN